MTLKLYELTEMYSRLLEMDSETDVSAALATIEEDIRAKAENCAKLIRSLEAEDVAYAAEVKRLTEHRQALVNRKERIKQYLLENLQLAGIEEVKGAVLKVRLQNSPAACQITDEQAIPEEYRQIVTTINYDKKAIIAAAKDGINVPGAEVSQGKHIRIYP